MGDNNKSNKRSRVKIKRSNTHTNFVNGKPVQVRNKSIQGQVQPAVDAWNSAVGKSSSSSSYQMNPYDYHGTLTNPIDDGILVGQGEKDLQFLAGNSFLPGEYYQHVRDYNMRNIYENIHGVYTNSNNETTTNTQQQKQTSTTKQTTSSTSNKTNTNTTKTSTTKQTNSSTGNKTNQRSTTNTKSNSNTSGGTKKQNTTKTTTTNTNTKTNTITNNNDQKVVYNKDGTVTDPELGTISKEDYEAITALSSGTKIQADTKTETTDNTNTPITDSKNDTFNSNWIDPATKSFYNPFVDIYGGAEDKSMGPRAYPSDTSNPNFNIDAYAGKYDNVAWNDPTSPFGELYNPKAVLSVPEYQKLVRDVERQEQFDELTNNLQINPTSDDVTNTTKKNWKDRWNSWFGASLSNDQLEKAPIYGNLAAVAADIFGLRNKNDFTEAKMLEDYANGLSANTVTYNPNYNYATYTPTNLNSTTDALLGANSGVVANLNNTGMGASERMAATLQNNKNLFTSMGSVVNQINQTNNAEKNNVRATNNAIDAQNAQQSMAAQQYNATARQTVDAQRLAAMQQALALRLNERQTNAKAKADDLNALFTNMFQLGRNNKNLAAAQAIGGAQGYNYDNPSGNIQYNPYTGEKLNG